MTWSDYHTLSQHAAASAEVAARDGRAAQARDLYREAAIYEEVALRALAPDKPRTLGITAVSVAALWYQAGDYARAEHAAVAALEQGTLPAFAIFQLAELVGAAQEARDGAPAEPVPPGPI